LVKIRLKRMGAKKRPFYRLVVADSRSPRDGRFIELLGFYDPLTEPAKVQVDADKVREWMRRGARPSDAARALLVREGILARTPRVFAAPAKETPEPVAGVEEGAAAEAGAGGTADGGGTDAAPEDAGAGEPEAEPEPAAVSEDATPAAEAPVSEAAEPEAAAEPAAEDAEAKAES
jgi:small subunit ribosomal protein S16